MLQLGSSRFAGGADAQARHACRRPAYGVRANQNRISLQQLHQLVAESGAASAERPAPSCRTAADLLAELARVCWSEPQAVWP